MVAKDVRRREFLSAFGRAVGGSAMLRTMPGMDITPPELVSSIVTDRGIFAPAKINSYVDADPFVTDAIL